MVSLRRAGSSHSLAGEVVSVADLGLDGVNSDFQIGLGCLREKKLAYQSAQKYYLTQTTLSARGSGWASVDHHRRRHLVPQPPGQQATGAAIPYAMVGGAASAACLKKYHKCYQ